MGRHGMVARWAWMACGAVALVAVLAVSGQVPTGLAAQCEIRPRFRVLAEALPELIGNCVAPEALNGETGDIEQPVDGGVLVLRSADNTPTFTDGWQTWVAGPNGIETRLNSERLAWEPGEASLAVAAVAPDEAAVVPDGGTLLATRPALDVADMYAGVAPSVVKILVSDGAGSGVRVAAGIVTNAHVVGDETSVTVVLGDGQQVTGTVVKVDQVADLALVTAEGWIPELEIERASFQRIGDSAYVVGFPRSSEIGGAASLSRGIISGFRNGQPGVSWIQTDASMNPGNSGGGLFNGQGKLIGIPAWKLRGADGLNFAISADTVTAFLARPGSRRGAAPTVPTTPTARVASPTPTRSAAATRTPVSAPVLTVTSVPWTLPALPPIATSASVVVPTRVPVARVGETLFADTFSDPLASKLPVGNNPGVNNRYIENGEYVIHNYDAHAGFLGNAHAGFLGTTSLPNEYSNSRIMIDARLIDLGASDKENDHVALECRGNSNGDGYRLTVGSVLRGQFSLSVWRSGIEEKLVDGWNGESNISYMSPIVTGYGRNRMELTCTGSSIRAKINGVQVASVQDYTYQTGEVWFGVGFYNGSAKHSQEARFDNLIVIQE